MNRLRFIAKTVLALCLGILIAQGALSIIIERAPVEVHDPEYAFLERNLQARIAENPQRPLTVFVGSSLVSQGFDARSYTLNNTSQELAYNFSIPGTAPFMQKIIIDRLLQSKIVPQKVFLEINQSFWNETTKPNPELTMLNSQRCTWAELQPLRSYRANQRGAWKRYALARSLPAFYHQAECKAALGLDRTRQGTSPIDFVPGYDEFGLKAMHIPVEQWPAMKKQMHHSYDPQCQYFAPSPDSQTTLLKLTDQLKQRQIEVYFVVMPESNAFRSLKSDQYIQRFKQFLTDLEKATGVEIIDARPWVSDPHFYDDYHITIAGANQFTSQLLHHTQRSPREPKSAALGKP